MHRNLLFSAIAITALISLIVPAATMKAATSELYLESNTRKQGRPERLWVNYKHGIIDNFATPIDLKRIIANNPKLEKYLAKGEVLKTFHPNTSQPVLKVSKSGHIELPLTMPIGKLKGKTIRFFYWVKAKNAADTKGWHAPNIVFTLQNKAGKVIYSRDSYHHTAGTFPWHCYYKEYYIPKNAAKAKLKFYNKFRGTAWFTCPSWEIIKNNGPTAYSKEERQDPVTGSLAANVRYDQMPEHVRDLGNKYTWNYLKGNLPGQPYDITTCKGFKKYYFEKAKTCPEHMNHAILYMGTMYYQGKKLKLLPSLEKGWLDNFSKILMQDQDPETGYWHDGKALSLGLTFHLCNMFFRYYDLPRTDRKDIIKSQMGLVKYVPRAKEIILQTLRQQSTWINNKKVKRPAAWNKKAYRFTLTPDKYKSKSYLGSTWDAIYLLRLASRYVNPELQQKVYYSVKWSFRYLLEKNVLPDGSWLQSDTDKHVTRYTYVNRIMEDTSWLERKIDPARPTPNAALHRLDDNRIEVKWQPESEDTSLRIYIVPKDLKPEQINERYLAGAIQRTGHKFYEMEPFVAAEKMIEQAVKRLGPKMKLPPASSWQGKRYLPWKMRMIKRPLLFTCDNKPLVLSLENPDNSTVYVGSSNWYGEESAPVKLSLTQK